MSNLQTGQIAPDFRLPAVNHEGGFQLSQYRGRFVILFFYPKAFAVGCTKEACAFRDMLPYFVGRQETGTVVAGISPDTQDAHETFAVRYKLTYPLLSDSDHAIAEAYGVWGEMEFKGVLHPSVIRSTFLIDPDGVICRMYYNVPLKGHTGILLDDLKSEKRRLKAPHKAE